MQFFHTRQFYNHSHFDSGGCDDKRECRVEQQHKGDHQSVFTGFISLLLQAG